MFFFIINTRFKLSRPWDYTSFLKFYLYEIFSFPLSFIFSLLVYLFTPLPILFRIVPPNNTFSSYY